MDLQQLGLPYMPSFLTLYQLDLNEITLGSFLLNTKTYWRFAIQVNMSMLNLMKALFLEKNSRQLDIDFVLIMKYHDIATGIQKDINLGNYNVWKSNLLEWFMENNSEANLYIESFYIFAYHKQE